MLVQLKDHKLLTIRLLEPADSDKLFQYLEQQHRLQDSLLPTYFEVLKQLGQYKEAKKLVTKQNPETWKKSVQSW